ncbi:hypothetical protein [Amycolatopsis sp. cmx-4-83]|uniref:hypothetical protein n=1 Tax=Amycolatopsis sp. cmx-4-83 TaxID=2790940 RepID=UPI00397C19C8
MTFSPSFAVTVVAGDHGAPTLFVHRLNHELEAWTTFESDQDYDVVLGRLGFARAGEWSMNQHGAQQCTAQRSS